MTFSRFVIFSSGKVFLNFTKDIKESGNIASLHKQIAACDTILEVNIPLKKLQVVIVLL